MKTREDWLCEQIDRDDLSDALRTKYEQELDHIANAHTRRQVIEQELEVKKQAMFADIKARMLANDLNVIDAFGIPEFGDDYEVVLEGSTYVVYSKVAADGQNNRHMFNTAEEANSKFRKLVWDRLYHKYVRTGEVSHLSELAS